MRLIVLVAHNLRSTHNVGSLLRTAEGLGVERVVFTGYTPYPETADDPRLPHIVRKISVQIQKTALGAERTIKWSQEPDVGKAITQLKAEGYEVAALEQSSGAVPLPQFQPTDKRAILIGREVEGLEETVLRQADRIVEIPMFGKKESFNVVQAAAMALYHCRFYPL